MNSADLREVRDYIENQISSCQNEIKEIQGQMTGLSDALSKVKIVIQRNKTEDRVHDV